MPRKRRSRVPKTENCTSNHAMHESNSRKAKPIDESQHISSMEQEKTDFKKKGEHQALPHHSKAEECQPLIPVEAKQTALEKSKMKNGSGVIRKKQTEATKKPQIVEDNSFVMSLKVTNILLEKNIVCSTCKTNQIEIRLVDDERRIAVYCRMCTVSSELQKGEHQALPHHSKAEECQPLIPVEAKQTALEKNKMKNDSGVIRKKQTEATKKPQIVEDSGFVMPLKITNTMLGKNIVCSTCKTTKVEVRLVDDEISFERRIAFYCRMCKEILKQTPAFDRINFPEFAPNLESTSDSNVSCNLDRILASLGSLELAEYLSNSNNDYHTKTEFKIVCKASAALLQKCYNNMPTSDSNGSCNLDRVSTFLGSSELAKCLSNPNNDYHTERGFQLFSQASAAILQKWDDDIFFIVNIIRKIYIEAGERPDEQGIVNIAAVYYGSFITRGQDSLIAVGVIVEPEIGLIIDIQVACKYCVLCKRERGRKTKAEFDAWYITHHKLCQLNFEKEFVDNMKSENAILLFKRSTDLGLRYTTVIEANNSAVYQELCESNVYGDQHKIKKMNFLDHMCKKIYKHLEQLRTVGPLVGSGVGFLRKGGNKLHSMLYRVACLSHSDNHQKIRDVMTSCIEHHVATDENPTHNLCSPSWCGYKREVEKGNMPGPGWHRDNRPYYINEEVASGFKKIFDKYLQESFLNRVTGHGEISDKILHAKIREFLPNAGKEGVEFVKTFVTYVALEHNEDLGVIYIRNMK